jgi:hypothetical protein
MVTDVERLAQLEEWAANIEQRNHPYEFRVRIGVTEGMAYPFVQVQCFRPDVFTGEMGWGGSGKAYVSQYCTESEFYQMCLGMGLAYVEHEFREGFHVKGERPFHPHISTDALIEASRTTDARTTPTVAPG